MSYVPGKINPAYAGLHYPVAGDQGRFTIGCSCGQWSFTGTAEECIARGRSHDDSPWQWHIVSVKSWHV